MGTLSNSGGNPLVRDTITCRALTCWILAWLAVVLPSICLLAYCGSPHHHHDDSGAVTIQSQEPRDPRWPAARAAWLRSHPTCEACGTSVGVQVHHIRPFHLFPELELSPSNFITLCGPESRNCHLYVGHSGDFKAWNPHAAEDAALLLKRKAERKYTR